LTIGAICAVLLPMTGWSSARPERRGRPVAAAPSGDVRPGGGTSTVGVASSIAPVTPIDPAKAAKMSAGTPIGLATLIATLRRRNCCRRTVSGRA
jgi:hypothetical protein